MKIKTNYLNYFALEKTYLPDIVKILSTLNIMNHIC